MNNFDNFSPENPYYSLNIFCKKKFGEKVARVPLSLHQTCPNRTGGKPGCIFCLPAAYEPAEILSAGNIKQQFQNFINLRAKFYKAKKYIAYLQSGSNTAGSPAFLEAAYKEALAQNDVVALSISTRPDCLEHEILKVISDLAKENEIWVELGVQTAHNKSLDFLNRGHDNEASLDAIRKLKDAGISHIVAHIILGIPGETEKDMIDTIRIFSDAGVDGFKIHHLQVTKNTPLEKMWRENNIPLFSLDEYIDLLVRIVEVIPQHIVIHRLIGSSNEEYLLAPRWKIKKTKIFSDILNKFKEKNSFQGKHV